MTKTRRPTPGERGAASPVRRLTLGRTTAACTAATLAILAAWVPLAPSATADAVPFTDPNTNGYIGFCDQHGHQVRSGDIGSAPFALIAVSSTAAPDGYGAGIGRAELNVYQPRRDVDPAGWSGKGLTATSLYTNSAHPMAQGTGRDPALVDFVSVFPPNWDGLVQLRMYFTAPNKPQHSIPYPATVVQVSGTTWTVVSGGDVPCNAGKALSVEAVNLPSSILNAPTARSTPGAINGSTPGATNGSSAGANANGPASGANATAKGASPAASGSGGRSDQPSNPSGDSAPAGASKKSSGGSAGPIAWVALALAVAVGGVVLLVRRYRRGTT